jgi:glutathione peroxidase
MKTALGVLLAGVGLVCAGQPAAVEQATPAVSALSGLALTQLDGTALDSQVLDGQVVLFVNVASKCGFTPQYDELQALYTEKQSQGLVIVGVPCNQFGGQEPGTAQEIASFCRINYGVSFPLLEKQDVNGPQRSALYQWLVQSSAGGGKDVRWNFEKFLVDRNGQVVERFSSRVGPNDGELRGLVERALAGE